MNEQSYNQQALNEYLLGALPAAEAERFDELSFTDEDFADALVVAEKDLVDAYVNDDLTGAALERFKTHYLASPMRREKVEFARAFQIYAEKNLPEKPAAAETKPKRIFDGFFANFFAVSRPALQWSFALAALAFLFTGVWLFRENSRLRFEMSQADANREQLAAREAELAAREKQLQDEAANRISGNSATETELARVLEERARLEEQLKKQLPEAQPRLAESRKSNDQPRLAEQRSARDAPTVSAPRLAVASFVLAPSLRGGSKVQIVSIPPRTGGVSATLELERDEYIAYRAVLRSAAGEKNLWQSGALKSKSVGGNTRLYVNFPAKLLSSGVFSIELTGIAADGEAEIISDYSFRVVR